MFGPNIKARIQEHCNEAVKAFQEQPEIETKFDAPVIGYADTRDPLFDLFYNKELTLHPRRIYRPGHTVVVHFVPYAEDVVRKNESGKEPAEAWKKAFYESMWIGMRLNGVIRETLDTVGRLCSCTAVPTDWDETVFHEEWSNKLAAVVAGIGTLGPAGSFRIGNHYGGRLSSVITDGYYAEKDLTDTREEEMEALYQALMRQSCYRGAEGVSCSREMIEVCPGHAVSADGIDRRVCQDYCRTLNEVTPSPDMCGKCFRFAGTSCSGANA